MDRARSSASDAPGEQPAAPRGEERRVVTTLFCDLVGFTALSERNDPEIVDAFLRRYYSVARKAIESYGGTVEKFIGDAVVAVFGVPSLHEDDPERAVRAGLRIVDEIDALPGIGGRPVEVRVGVNTGEALVRLAVDPASGEGFLTGDAVNTAARLQSAAPTMAVAVGELTHAATEQVFRFDACHRVTVKGKREPLRAWIATAPLARTGSELRSFASAFVGREQELAGLDGLLDETAASGHLHCALICGEPGIGKSRLLAEFARRLDERPDLVTWRQGRCLPFGSNVTFWALSEIVRAEAGVLESDGVARTEARLEAVLPEVPDRGRLRARLRPLLGLEAEEASREENFAAWREFLESLAVAGPAIVVVEDLHWADDAMLAFIDHLAQADAAVSLLLLATARPETLELTGSGSSFVASARRLSLGPLSGEETAELARARLGAKSLPADLQALILERSGGNPLFAEELVRLLQDRGLVEERGGKVVLRPGEEVPTPDSIGALIAARLDLLAPERKTLLADAAVVGRSFWAGAVAAVGGDDPVVVLEGLLELVAKELVHPERSSSIEGETEFSFVHALVCDVAYEQLTRADRAEKHARLARWLEERTAGRTEDLAEVLAFHYGTALDMANVCGLFDLEDELAEPTSRYLELAGGRAAPLDAAAAAQHFARAERVADEAARPKRRFLLSRRTRRTLKRRAPLLLAATAVIVVALVAALAIWRFGPEDRPSVKVRLTADQIANTYGSSVVRITTPPMPPAATGKKAPNPIVGSGFVVTKNGVIATSLGTVQGRGLNAPPTVTVEYVLPSGQYGKVKARVLYHQEDSGLAFIKVDPRVVALKPLPFADSESVHEGQGVVVLGTQAGMYLMRAAGKVTGLEDNVQDGNWGNHGLGGFYFEAAYPKPVNPEPLTVIGGPVFDRTGHVVGLVGQLAWGTHGYGIWGYDGDIAHEATAINLVKLTVTGVTSVPAPYAGHGAYLGLAGQWVSSKVANALGQHAGDLVEEVMIGSPADRAGIRSGTTSVTSEGGTYRTGGDVIVAVDGMHLNSQFQLGDVISRFTPGDDIPIRLWRDDRLITVRVKLAKVP